jgi:hypothetical protein
LINYPCLALPRHALPCRAVPRRAPPRPARPHQAMPRPAMPCRAGPRRPLLARAAENCQAGIVEPSAHRKPSANAIRFGLDGPPAGLSRSVLLRVGVGAGCVVESFEHSPETQRRGFSAVRRERYRNEIRVGVFPANDTRSSRALRAPFTSRASRPISTINASGPCNAWRAFVLDPEALHDKVDLVQFTL